MNTNASPHANAPIPFVVIVLRAAQQFINNVYDCMRRGCFWAAAFTRLHARALYVIEAAL